MKLVLFGAGKMAYAIAHDLVRNPLVSDVVVGDISLAQAQKLTRSLRSKKLRAVDVDVTRKKDVARLLEDARAAVGATTYAHNLMLTEACIAAGAHFCDLGGNNDIVKAQHALHAQARKAGVAIVPDCGLAPGMVNILGYHWAHAFDHVDTLEIRVGGLPQTVTNRLGYQIAFSVEGLINEYIEKAVILRDGKKSVVPSMTGLETLGFAAPYDDLEAFYTSGGTSTLPQTLAKKATNLDYKTIRYRGHAAQIALLMELGLCSSEPVTLGKIAVKPRQLLATLLTRYLPVGEPDVVLIRLTVRGSRAGRPAARTYDCVDHADPKTRLSAMQRTTGFSAAIVAQLLAAGDVVPPGVTPQELGIPGDRFLQELAARGIRFTESDTSTAAQRKGARA